MTNYFYKYIFKENENSDSIFLINEEQEVSYKNFSSLINQISNLLLLNNLKPNDRVAVKAPKSIIQLALYFATIKCGGIYLPLNTGYTAQELKYFLEDSNASFLIIDPNNLDDLSNSLDVSSFKIFTLDRNGNGSLKSQYDSLPITFNEILRNKNDLAAILYTSGTTGKSKGAKLTHENLVSNALVLKDYWQFKKNDVLLHMLPIYHTHGLFVACNLLSMVGGKIIFLNKFDVEDTIKWLKFSSTMMGVPTFYSRLIQSEKLTKDVTKNIRLFISGSAPLLPEIHKIFEEKTGHIILERYGMTETNMSISNPYDGKRIAGTVGKPLPGIEMRIVDPKTNISVKKGEIGIIELKGKNVFEGYWNMPEKDKESFKEDGFFITGDMAKIDKNDYVIIVGRDKDLIISGGLNVYPKEIEEIINDIDGIEETAIVGVPHSDFGEAVIAIIKRTKNNVDENFIFDYLQNKLAKFKKPKKIIFVHELPRNTMGKVQKANLREKYKAIFKN